MQQPRLQQMQQAIADAAAKYELPTPHIALKYGTAGFRARHDLLDAAFFRVGLVAALRAKALSSGRASSLNRGNDISVAIGTGIGAGSGTGSGTGIGTGTDTGTEYNRLELGTVVGAIVTASHNPPLDNGVKLIDANGSLLGPEWEQIACRIVNADSTDLAALVIDLLIRLTDPVGIVTTGPAPTTELGSITMETTAAADDPAMAQAPATAAATATATTTTTLAAEEETAPAPTAPTANTANTAPTTATELATMAIPAQVPVPVQVPLTTTSPMDIAVIDASNTDIAHAPLVTDIEKLTVIIGWDTRASSLRLAGAIADGVHAFGAIAMPVGLCTTPQLHVCVAAANSCRKLPPIAVPLVLPSRIQPSRANTGIASSECKDNDTFIDITCTDCPVSGTESEVRISETANDVLDDLYIRPLAEALDSAIHELDKQNLQQRTVDPLYVDCANGVGAPKLAKLQRFTDTIKLELINTDIESFDKLNIEAGADFVKMHQRLPSHHKWTVGARIAAIDGDADRLVYAIAIAPNGPIRLLDGDKIACLLALFLTEQLKVASGPLAELRLGVVQTAYTNGSCTNYIEKVLELPVRCVPTGVKHLHREAQQSFDIGIYFEANGHGTVLFSLHARNTLASFKPQSPAQMIAARRVQLLAEIINQFIGDAIADLCAVEFVLVAKRWSAGDWDAIYEELPSCLLRVVVADRTIYKTENAERRLVAPKGLQGEIDALVAKYKHGRAFVRASGTEDAVRVYAEAATRIEAEELARKIKSLLI